jgi:hypothetical protein
MQVRRLEIGREDDSAKCNLAIERMIPGTWIQLVGALTIEVVEDSTQKRSRGQR